jgi:hypothetical protein
VDALAHQPVPDPLEQHNLREIEALNQRGGRTLSLVDLIHAETLSPEVAGFLLWRVAHGASFLTGAVPGGAGKSTLLANLLAMLPPGERIVTTPDDAAVRLALRQTPRTGRCYLCHEIGVGHWYGYLWGTTVGRFSQLRDAGGRIAGCLHADDPAQLRSILLSPTLGVTPEALAGVEVLLFMAYQGSRVVRSVWVADGEGDHALAYRHGEALRVPEGLDEASAPTLAECLGFIARLLEGPARLFEEVRREVVAFYA